VNESNEHMTTASVARKRRQRIGVRVVIASLLGSVVISTLVSVLQIYFTYQESVQAARQRFEQIETGYLPSLAGNLWEVNASGVNALLDGIASLPDVGRVELIDEMQQSVVRNAGAGDAIDRREFVLSHEQQEVRHELGLLRVDLTDRHIVAQLKSRALEIGAMIYVALLVNSLVVLALLHRLIIRHVGSIARFASTVDVSSMTTPLALERARHSNGFDDELDQVVDSLNAMQQRLREELARRAVVEQDLRQHRENLEMLVTERTLAYNASAAQLAIAADVAELGVWSMDIQTNALSWNQRMFEIYAVPSAFRDIGLTVESWIRRLHPDDAERSLSALRHAIDTQGLYVDQFRILNDAGVCRHIRAKAQIVRAANGKPATVIGINYDITEQIEFENHLKRARDDAEAGARAKAEFLAAMSHEIRTPMNGVLGMLNLLLRTDLDKEQHRRLLLAKNSADHLLTVINDILDFSKIDAGKLVIDADDFDLVQQIGDSVQGLSLRAQEKALELVVDVSDVRCSWVRGDAGRLRQILVNLIGNAIKFTEHGEVVVRCRQQVDANAIHLAVAISDTGIGIAEENIASLFTAFSQVDASTTRRFGGTGLGLVISKKLCELMGGDISVSSSVGRGSCFTFDIWLQPAQAAPQTLSQTLPQRDLRGVDILVVDDSDTNRDVLGQQLAAQGATVTLAANAQDALEICERRSKANGVRVFDIGIVDMQMPGVSGAELGLRLLEDPRWSHLKLILMTAQRDDALVLASRGFNTCLPKPVMPMELQACIARVLSNADAPGVSLPPLLHDPALQNRTGTPWPANTRVLLVEDNPVNQDVAGLMLADFGIEADVAQNGREAIDKMRAVATTPYALILMDCQMPEMDGFAASRAIRNGQAGEMHRDVMIIALTANAMEGDRERCLQAGMNDYLSKPLDDRALFNKLQQWLLRTGTTAQQTALAIPAAAAEAAVVWDRVAALHNLKGRRERLRILVDMFLQGLPAQLAFLAQHSEQSGDPKGEHGSVALDFDKIAYSAHTIKGSAGQLKALQVEQQAATLEVAARDHRADDCVRCIAQLESACATLVQLLDEFTRSTPGDVQ